MSSNAVCVWCERMFVRLSFRIDYIICLKICQHEFSTDVKVHDATYIVLDIKTSQTLMLFLLFPYLIHVLVLNE